MPSGALNTLFLFRDPRWPFSVAIILWGHLGTARCPHWFEWACQSPLLFRETPACSTRRSRPHISSYCQLIDPLVIVPYAFLANIPGNRSGIITSAEVESNNSYQYPFSVGPAVAQWLRCCATNRKVAGSIPDGVIGIFHWHNPSDRTMALGLAQPLTEMSTRRISWG